jgi:predicted amidohydrolase YtcJ
VRHLFSLADGYNVKRKGRVVAHTGWSRRNFMQIGGLGAAGLLTGVAPWPVRAAQRGAPDQIVVNANIYTVDDGMPRAQAFAVKDGRFIAVGATEDMKALAGSETQLVDAQGATVIPGFIDCHNHAPGTRLLNDVIVGNPYEVEFVTIDGIVDKLKARASTTPPGVWVEGQFFDDTKVKDGRELNVHDLDKVSLDHPVVVNHRPHVVLQQQGLAACRDHQGHAQPGQWHV